MTHKEYLDGAKKGTLRFFSLFVDKKRIAKTICIKCLPKIIRLLSGAKQTQIQIKVDKKITTHTLEF